MEHQDWNNVVLSKHPRSSGMSKQQQLTKAQRTGSLVTEKKFAAGENKAGTTGTGQSLRKLEEETEQFKHNRVDGSFARAMQQARLEKKWNQKQLATAINEKPNVIQDYESGRAIPNPQIISKIERALGVRLPRGGAKKKKATTA